MGDSLGRDEARRRKGRQVTRGEVVRTGAPSAMRRPAGRFGPSARTARRSRALHLGQVKGPMRHPAYQVVASVRLKVPWVSHGEQYTIDSVTPPLLLHQWGPLARRQDKGANGPNDPTLRTKGAYSIINNHQSHPIITYHHMKFATSSNTQKHFRF